MATKGKKISEVGVIDSLDGTELIPFSKNGTDGALTPNLISTFLDETYKLTELESRVSANEGHLSGNDNQFLDVWKYLGPLPSRIDAVETDINELGTLYGKLNASLPDYFLDGGWEIRDLEHEYWLIPTVVEKNGFSKVETPDNFIIKIPFAENGNNGVVKGHYIDELKELTKGFISAYDRPYVNPEKGRKTLELDKVDNTSDLDKPISTATQAALDQIKVPTKVSELTNDSGYITSADIPISTTPTVYGYIIDITKVKSGDTDEKAKLLEVLQKYNKKESFFIQELNVTGGTIINPSITFGFLKTSANGTYTRLYVVGKKRLNYVNEPNNGKISVMTGYIDVYVTDTNISDISSVTMSFNTSNIKFNTESGDVASSINIKVDKNGNIVAGSVERKVLSLNYSVLNTFGNSDSIQIPTSDIDGIEVLQEIATNNDSGTWTSANEVELRFTHSDAQIVDFISVPSTSVQVNVPSTYAVHVRINNFILGDYIYSLLYDNTEDNVTLSRKSLISQAVPNEFAFTKQLYNYFNTSNPNTGQLVALNIRSDSNTMCVVNIKGLTYDGDNKKLPKDSILQFYVYNSVSGYTYINTPNLLHLGYNFGDITILDVDGWIHLFFKEPNNYCSVLVQAFATYSTSATTGIDLVRSIGISEIPANATILKEVKPSNKPLPNNFVTENNLTEELRGKFDLAKTMFVDQWNARCKVCSSTSPNPNIIKRNTFGRYNEETGYFELNGLTDITYEQAVEIMNVPDTTCGHDTPNQNYQYSRARTFFPIKSITVADLRQLFGCLPNAEVVRIVNYYIINNGADPDTYPQVVNHTRNMFSMCPRLREVKGVIRLNNTDDMNVHLYDTSALALETLWLQNICLPVHLQKFPKLSLASMQYMIEHAANTTTITINVHSDIYAKLTDETNTEWNKVLTDAEAKQITFVDAATLPTTLEEMDEFDNTDFNNIEDEVAE